MWYLLILALTAGLIGSLLYFQLRHSLYEGVDQSLQAATFQAGANIERERAPLTFHSKRDVDFFVESKGRRNFAVRLLSMNGKLLDGDGAYLLGPDWPAPRDGFTDTKGRGGSWRVLGSRVVSRSGAIIGWLQVAEATEYIGDALKRFGARALLEIPFLLLLAAAGGLLLVRQGLKPVNAMIATAKNISSSDLDRRIAYEGPRDELSHLAQTFNRMLDRLKDGFEVERRFTADVSHELRTPLSAIKGQLDVAMSRERSPGEYQEVLSALARQTDRLIRLTNDLLFLAVIEHAEEPRTERVNLGDLVEATLDHLKPLADAKPVSIEMDGIGQNHYVRGNFDQLMRLVYNLLDNAVKYTPAGGHIEVGVDEGHSGEVRLEVANTGPGIAAYHLPRIFDRFYRVADDRNRSSGGSGLGLALAHEIARAHGGNISAESIAGERTVFVVNLPRN